MTYLNLITALKGGAGSGNFGHSGRPGKRGGSAPKSGLSAGKRNGITYLEPSLEDAGTPMERKIQHAYGKLPNGDTIDAVVTAYTNPYFSSAVQVDYTVKPAVGYSSGRSNSFQTDADPYKELAGKLGL